jgi:hypothetical protein
MAKKNIEKIKLSSSTLEELYLYKVLANDAIKEIDNMLHIANSDEYQSSKDDAEILKKNHSEIRQNLQKINNEIIEKLKLIE